MRSIITEKIHIRALVVALAINNLLIVFGNMLYDACTEKKYSYLYYTEQFSEEGFMDLVYVEKHFIVDDNIYFLNILYTPRLLLQFCI